MITLIATGHVECGNCNSNELYKIIEQIAPEVIYEEIPPGKFTAVYEGALKDSLEVCVIKRYLQKHPIAHFPVDLDTDKTTEMHIRNSMREIFYIFTQLLMIFTC